MAVVSQNGSNTSSLRVVSGRPAFHSQACIVKADVARISYEDPDKDDDAVSVATSEGESWYCGSFTSGSGSDAGEEDHSVDARDGPIFAFDEEAFELATQDCSDEDEVAPSGSFVDLFFFDV